MSTPSPEPVPSAPQSNPWPARCLCLLGLQLGLNLFFAVLDSPFSRSTLLGRPTTINILLGGASLFCGIRWRLRDSPTRQESRLRGMLTSGRTGANAVVEGAVLAAILGVLVLYGTTCLAGGTDLGLATIQRAVQVRTEDNPASLLAPTFLAPWVSWDHIPFQIAQCVQPPVRSVVEVSVLLIVSVFVCILAGYLLGFLIGVAWAQIRLRTSLRKRPLRILVFIFWTAANIYVAFFLPAAIRFVLLMNQGDNQLQGGDAVSALTWYTEALDIAPRCRFVREARARAYRALGQLDQAITEYTELITLQDNAPEYYIERARLYFAKHNYEQTIADADEATQLYRVRWGDSSPPFADDYRIRTEALIAKGDWDRAIADYTALIERECGWAYLERGRIHLRKGDIEPALADFDEAIRNDPLSALPFYGRGLICAENRGELDRGIADFTRAIRLAPGYAWAYHMRGWSYGQKGDFDRAITDCNEAIRLDGNVSHFYRNRGWTHLRRSEYHEAIADCSEAIRLDPKDAAAFAIRGAAYVGTEKYDQAVSDLSRAIRLNPRDAKAYLNRSKAYQEKGDLERAGADWDVANLLDPKATQASPRPRPFSIQAPLHEPSPPCEGRS